MIRATTSPLLASAIRFIPTCLAIGLTAASLAPQPATQGTSSAAGPPSDGITIPVVVRVLDPDGNPVPGADVAVEWACPGAGMSMSRETRHATTGNDGTVTLRATLPHFLSGGTVLARKSGLAINWARFSTEQPGETILTLGADPLECSGLVTDPHGNPLAGARVWARYIEVPRLSGPEARSPGRVDIHDDSFLSSMTDAAGGFSLPGLSRGGCARIAAIREGFEFRRLRDPVAAGAEDARVVLHPEAVITGRVTQEGRPVPGVPVMARRVEGGGPEGHVLTDDEGMYHIGSLGAGTWHVIFDPGDDRVAEALGPMVLQPAEHVPDQDTEAAPGAVVRGTVTDADTGAPVRWARINAYGPARPPGSRTPTTTLTDEAGAYQLRIAPGTNTLTCRAGYLRAGGHPDAMQSEAVLDVGEGEVLDGVDFAIAPTNRPFVRGHVVDANGQLLAGVKLGTVHRAGPRCETFEGQFTAESDVDGRFALPIDTPESYDGWPVLAMHREQGLAGIVGMPADAVPDEPIEIALSTGGHLALRVVDPAGNPLSDIPVRLVVHPKASGVGYSMSGGKTDADGTVRLGPLPVGPVYALEPDRQFHDRVAQRDRRRTALTRGEEADLGLVVINAAGGSVAGRILDAEGGPVEGARACFSGMREPFITDADGRFAAVGLPASGMLWVVAWHSTEPLFAAQNIDPDIEAELSLVLQEPCGATGWVVDDAGNPVAGAKLNAAASFPVTWPDGSRRLSILPWQTELRWRLSPVSDAPATTDEAGTWQLEGLIPGAHYVIGVEFADGTKSTSRYDFVTDTEAPVTEAGELVARRR